MWKREAAATSGITGREPPSGQPPEKSVSGPGAFKYFLPHTLTFSAQSPVLLRDPPLLEDPKIISSAGGWLEGSRMESKKVLDLQGFPWAQTIKRDRITKRN